MLEGKKEAQLHKLHKLTPLLWDDVLPSRTEVLSQSMHCAKCLPRTNPPTAPTPMNARVQGIVFWRYRPEQEGLQGYATGGLEESFRSNECINNVSTVP